MKITFLGGGNMANALIGGMLKRGFAAADITVIDPGSEARARLQQTYGVNCRCRRRKRSRPATCAAAGGQAATDARGLRPARRQAGPGPGRQHCRRPRLATLSRFLGGHRKIVRCMPNTPALIGAGITGLCALPEVDEAGRAAADRVLAAVGSTVWIDDEARMDGVTALSGSGPAYVFLFIEALQQAAAELGFTAEQGRQLAIETVQGAAALAAQSSEPASVLRERVTSKGGTTEAALRHDAGSAGVKEGIVAGVKAAEMRGRELGQTAGSRLMEAVFSSSTPSSAFSVRLFMLRFLMQMARVSFAGQIGDFVVKLTNWAVKPLRRIVPGMAAWTGPAWSPRCGCSCCWPASLWRYRVTSRADGVGMLLMILMFAIRGCCA
jgi:pyrroline-5-carboxylate reductase